MFLTDDEHGGFFDHVTPPQRASFSVRSLKHTSYRMRVHAHTSVLRLVQARADLPALTARDANDEPPFEFFDFEPPSFLIPPTLPQLLVDAVQEKRCIAMARHLLVERRLKKCSEDARTLTHSKGNCFACRAGDLDDRFRPSQFAARSVRIR